ncbi:MAG: hypothetical protein QXS12_02405, partial [Candidatus Caldarchaeum sp.]
RLGHDDVEKRKQAIEEAVQRDIEREQTYQQLGLMRTNPNDRRLVDAILNMDQDERAAFGEAIVKLMQSDPTFGEAPPKPAADSASAKPKPKPEINIMPPIELPFKPELITATLQEIVTALQKALSQSGRSKTEAAPPQIMENRLILNEFIVKIEEELDKFLEKLREIFSVRTSITFSELVEGMPRLEAAKTFILLLFAAARRYVMLLQADEFSDLVILGGELFGASDGQQAGG